jgi:hypothetical protein
MPHGVGDFNRGSIRGIAMSLEQFRTSEFFRVAAPAGSKGAVSGVDRAGKRILGGSIMAAGKIAPGDVRRLRADPDTLASLAVLGNSEPEGVKARFGHPSLFDDALGSYVGRWTNFRTDGTRTRADLQLADVAFNGPRGDLAGYLLDLAEQDPAAFGPSAVVAFDRAAMAKLIDADGFAAMRFSGLSAIDIVDSPAISGPGGMFSMLQPGYVTLTAEQQAAVEKLEGEYADCLQRYGRHAVCGVSKEQYVRSMLISAGIPFEHQ